MANMESLLRDFGERIKSEREMAPELFKDKNISATALSAGIEDAMGEDANVGALLNTIGQIAGDVNASLDSGDEALNPAQVKSGELISALAIDGISAIKELYGSKRKLDAGDEENVVTGYRYGMDDAIDVGMEYFDMQNTSTSMVINVVYNTFAPKQDEIAELFFPMVAVDPVKAGARIKATLINLWKEYKQTPDGAPAGDKINETPLIKSVTNTDLFTTENVDLVPVYRDTNKEKFFQLVQEQTEYMNETVTTAPLAFGKKMSLVGLAQTDEMLAKGGADFTDGINKSIKLREIYVRMTGKNSDGDDVTETFRFSLKNRNSWFNETLTGTSKQMVLNYDEDNFLMLTPDTKAIDTDGSEIDSEIMANLPANLEVNLELSLTGNANIAYGDVVTHFQTLSIKEIRTKDGALVDPSSDDYGKVNDVVASTVPGGYVLVAHATLSNGKRKGLTVLTRKQTAIVTIPYRTGFTEYMPVVAVGDDGDPTNLMGQIMGTRMKLNAYAIRTIMEFVSDMRANPKQKIQGLSQFFVNNYFLEDTISLAQLVDSIKSTERVDDIKAALLNKINLIVTDMILKSNYKIARDTLGYTGPIDVLIGMSLKLKLTLFGETSQELKGNLRFNYAGSPFKELDDKIVITLGVRNGNQNKDIDPLNFGVCLWSPELVINTKKTIGEGVRTEASTFPRFLHYINLPIISVLNVSDVDSIASKNVYITQS